MSELETIKQSFAEAFAELKKQNEKSELEIKKYGEANTETKALIEKYQTALDKLDEKFAALETRLNRPQMDDDPKVLDEKREALARKAFNEFARHDGQVTLKQYVESSPTESARELKALATDQQTEGGIFVPRNMDQTVIPYLREMDDVWDVCRVETITVGDTWEAVLENSDTFTTAKTTERGSRTETATPGFRMVSIPVHERYAYPGITQKMIDDSNYDVVGWVADRANEQMGIEAAADFIAGTGSGEPFGIVTRIATGTNLVSTVNSGHATLIKADGLIELADDMPERYLNGAVWMMARQTKRVIRQLKDGAGNYLWERSFTAGKPSSLLDYPIRLAPSLATPTAGAYTGSTYPVLFGNFREGYAIVRRQGVQVLRDPYSSKPYVMFHFTYRVGGDVLNNAAIKALKISA